MTPETMHDTANSAVFPLRRPVTLAAAARFGARRYRRIRDLPGAVSGLLAGDPAAILPRLVAEERRCEQARRARSSEYRPAQHVQILSALLAEAAARPCFPAHAPAEHEQLTRECPRKRLNGHNKPEALPIPPKKLSPAWRGPQAKASGSEALRLAT
jgi:hypothetical protein